MADSVEEKNVHWADEAEAIKSNKPLKFVLILFKLLPTFIVHLFCYPVAFFFFESTIKNAKATKNPAPNKPIKK